MDVSIILCTYNRCDRLEKVLQSLGSLKGHPEITWEVIVVDNNSKDRTKDVVEGRIRSGADRVRYVFEGRQGKSFALNTGINAARGAVLAFTDDDVTVHPQWLWELKKTFDTYECMGAGGKIIPVFEEKGPSWLRLDVPHPFLNALVAFDLGDKPCALRTAPFGANVAFRKEAFEKYGLYRTDMGPTKDNPLGKGEDTEFSSRVLSAGETMMYAPDAIVYHPVEQERIQKKYFESWYYNFGRASMTRSALPDRTVYYFGVPRYLYRQVFTRFLAWIMTLDGNERFCRKLELYETAGAMVESSRRHRADAASKQQRVAG
jgi:glycosyltransferase involved in cell wall biosynthesis